MSNPTPSSFREEAEKILHTGLRFEVRMLDALEALHKKEVERIKNDSKPPQQHYRSGAGRCICGFNAYSYSGIMLDYGEILRAHFRSVNRTRAGLTKGGE